MVVLAVSEQMHQQVAVHIQELQEVWVVVPESAVKQMLEVL